VLKELNLCLKDLEKSIELGDSLSRFDFCCLASLKEASKGTADSYKEALRKLSPTEGFTLQKGHIFQQSDLFFYKGVYFFYLAQYTEALKFFTKSKNLKQLNNELIHLEAADPNKYTSDMFDNKTYTDVEIDYNMALCELVTGNKENARKVLLRYESFTMMFEGDRPK
jgi:tetratricopeptide (TPR) repeat protein